MTAWDAKLRAALSRRLAFWCPRRRWWCAAALRSVVVRCCCVMVRRAALGFQLARLTALTSTPRVK